MRSTKKGGQPVVTAQEAVQLLQSAVAYLQMAGLKISAANDPDYLVLFIPNVHYVLASDGAAQFQVGPAPDETAPTE